MGIFLDGEMVEWFKAAVLKTAEVQASASSNLALSAIFFVQKNGERRRKSSLHCAKHNFTQSRRFSSLPRRNAMKPGHLHQTPEKTYLLVPP